MDTRVIVDLRFFGRQDGRPENKIIFEDDIDDLYGMPQPTFEYRVSEKFALEARRMMKE
jgi:pyranose oxidase